MNRAWRLLLLPLAFFILYSCCSAPQIPAPAPFALSEWRGEAEVLTRYGAVRGFQDRDGTWVWKAVPYARPPLGELRWKAPRDPEPWTGVRIRHGFASPCTQFRPLSGGRIRGSEDCLYLNIWRPRSSEDGLPVYVWIHGGGNSIGSATFVPDYRGCRLARSANLVFVSVNYRLGPFGWFTHPALREGEPPEDASGNYGTLDLIQALKWIQENICAFGGDPDTVLIAGESAGAMNVLSLLLSPLAEGLFHRAVVQSGAPRTRSMLEGERASRRVLLRLLIRKGKAKTLEDAEKVLEKMPAEEVRSLLRSASDRELLRCYDPGKSGMIDNPSIFTDGLVLPAEGFAALDSGKYPGKAPLIIGSNKEELKMFLFLAGIPSWKSELYRAVSRYGSERWKAEGVDGIARRLARCQDQPSVYAYLFAWGAPDEKGRSPLPGGWGERLGSFHSLEIPFFLGTDTINGRLFTSLLFTEKNRKGREALSQTIRGYLERFLRTGDPNGPGLPRWSAWSNKPGADKSLLLDVLNDEPYIRMLNLEVSRESIEAAMQAELSGDLLGKTRDFLARYGRRN